MWSPWCFCLERHYYCCYCRVHSNIVIIVMCWQ
jgi:hypothetical protein